MKIVEGGVFSIPLYHGTSTAFVDSIVRYGLGARDIIQEWDVITFMKILYPYLKRHLASDEEWIAAEDDYVDMMKQKPGRGQTDQWRYGQCYVTPSVLKATHYALNDKMGSELISMAAACYERLAKRGVVVSELVASPSPIVDLLNSKPSPVLIQANRIPVDQVCAEDGSEMEEVLSKLQRDLDRDPEDFSSSTQSFSFQLLRPPPGSHLRFYKIINKDKYTPSFSFDFEEFSPGLGNDAAEALTDQLAESHEQEED